MTQVPRPRRLFAPSVVTTLATLVAPAPSASAAPPPAGGTEARSVLSSLDNQELQALHRMATLDVGGLRVTDKEPVDHPVVPLDGVAAAESQQSATVGEGGVSGGDRGSADE
ncbi:MULTISPECIES: hypothetical protein [unclassified Streptomyces]|uniref:Secreted protein n=1 Tax=Streptomyces sp. NBC_00119 TaxID=2975659 RepID=A0AAU1UKC8_9ACTN|nr:MULTISPECIES: hypothetical protein [unclassified Streptomyces]MCX4649977.1 hypothetical protein [Streptomyces sp. NBC_01446]MCX5320805.1 hypothetical protein [Streptomyces sp. NBC_00120]